MGFVDYTCILIFVLIASINAERQLLLEDITQTESFHSKLGRKCTENPPTLNSSSGVGSVVEIGGLKCYVTGNHHSKRAILLASDIFGYEAPNLRSLADKVAHSNYYVVVPDMFNGDPYDPTNTSRPLPVWIASHNPVKASESLKPVIKYLTSHGVSKIGVAGFCYGGKVAVELIKSRLVQTGVLLHPSLVTVDDIKEVKVPLAILGAENDQVSPPSLVKQFKEILSTKQIANFVKIFRDVSHGWTLRYKLDDKKAVKAAKRAHKHMLKWFRKTLK